MQRFGFFRPYRTDRGGVSPEPWHLSYAPVSLPALESLSLSMLPRAGGQSHRGQAARVARLPEIYTRFMLAVDSLSSPHPFPQCQHSLEEEERRPALQPPQHARRGRQHDVEATRGACSRMSRAASVARYLESRSACVARSRACRAAERSIRFVGTNVGITTETCVLLAASSLLSVSLNDRTAALVALYEIMPGADAGGGARDVDQQSGAVTLQMRDRRARRARRP